MKIVHTTQFFHPSRGYQENHLSIIQRKEGHEVAILATDDLTLWGIDDIEMKQMDEEFTQKYSIKIIRLHKIFEFSTRIFVTGLTEALETIQPDILIIHAVSLPMSISSMRWGAKHNTKMIVDDHMVDAGSFNKSAKYFYIIFKKVLPLYLKIFNIKIDKWIAVSDETKVFMLKNYGITEEIKVVPLGYDSTSVFKDKKGGVEWLRIHNCPQNISYILYIGKFDDMKNPIDLLEAFKKFKKQHIGYKLLMVGDPSKKYSERLNEKINLLGLSNDIYIVSSIPNNQIRKVFSIAKMAIWPHGSSMAMLEAMACECPVIAPDIGVNQERLSIGRGVMFKENDVIDLIEKMTYVLSHKNHLIINAKKWVLNFAWEKLACDFIK